MCGIFGIFVLHFILIKIIVGIVDTQNAMDKSGLEEWKEVERGRIYWKIDFFQLLESVTLGENTGKIGELSFCFHVWRENERSHEGSVDVWREKRGRRKKCGEREKSRKVEIDNRRKKERNIERAKKKKEKEERSEAERRGWKGHSTRTCKNRIG